MSELLNSPTESVVADYDRLRDDCALLELRDIALFGLTGEDRKGWLQGQVTQNVRHLERGNSSAFAFCQNTGHFLSPAEAWALDDEILVAVPKLAQPDVQSRLDAMIIMEDVQVALRSSHHRLFSVQGPRATARLLQLIPLPNLDAGRATLEGADIFVLRSNRTVAGGWDLWVPTVKRKVVTRLREAFPSASLEAYEIARIEAGIPKFGQDMNVRTIPMEMGTQYVTRTISFNKGCYIGQEVIHRIHSRGHTNRTWVGLQSEHPFSIGQTVGHLRNDNVGTVTSAAESPDFGFIGAAMIRNEAAFQGENVRIATPNGPVEAEVRLMPLLRLE